MVNPEELTELRRLVGEQLAQGKSKEEVREEMKKAGYLGGDITLALRDESAGGAKGVPMVSRIHQIRSWKMESSIFAPRILLGSLLHPTYTFKYLRDKITFGQGLLLYLIMAIISEFILVITLKFTLREQFERLFEAYPIGSLDSVGWIFNDQSLLVTTTGSILFGLVLFLAICFFSSRLTRGIAGGSADVKKTVALLAYVNILVLIFVGIPLTAVGTVISMKTPLTVYSIGTNPNLFLAFTSVFLVIMVFFWVLAGRAVAVANGVSSGNGMVSVLLAFLVVLGILAIIGTISGIMAVMGRFIPIPTGAFIFRGL
ncbi:MAG: hypothetical protein JXB14_03790 [Candidatus Altiarchaeota archaeon]|nr:hypothetical protein [Candidatus Altiarchaeota archaeon]